MEKGNSEKSSFHAMWDFIRRFFTSSSECEKNIYSAGYPSASVPDRSETEDTTPVPASESLVTVSILEADSKNQSAVTVTEKTSELNAETDAEKDSDIALEPLSAFLVTDECLQISSDLMMFLQDRIECIEEEDAGSIDWCIRIVDLLDELDLMAVGYSEKEKLAVDLLKEQLYKNLNAYEASVIDCDIWDPEKQRAVVVKKDPNALEKTILKKESLGIYQKDRLIRKQEVHLIIPEK